MGSSYNNPAQFFNQLAGFIQGEVQKGVSRKAKEIREISGLTEGGAFAGGTLKRKKGGRNVNETSSGPGRVARRAERRQAIIERNRQRKAARAEGRGTTPDESARLEDGAVPPKVNLSRFLENRGKEGLGGPQTVPRDTPRTPEVSLPQFLASLGMGYTEEQEGPPRDSGPEMSPRPTQPEYTGPNYVEVGSEGLTPEQEAQMQADINRSLAMPGTPIDPSPFNDEARRKVQMASDIAASQEIARQEEANRQALELYRRPAKQDIEISPEQIAMMNRDINRSLAMPGTPHRYGMAPNDFENMGPFPEDYYFQHGTAPPLDLPFGSNLDRIIMPPRLPDIPQSPSEAYFVPRTKRAPLRMPVDGPRFAPPIGPVLRALATQGR